MIRLPEISTELPILIAGPTASGKSALALDVAARSGGFIVNADALQVFSDWRVLTARPSEQDERSAPHFLYGHVPGDRPYSVGQWLRDLAPLLQDGRQPIIVGGTGLYFTALTEGLADIPAISPETRRRAERRLAHGGIGALLHELDAATLARLDPHNPMRVQRAWEVLSETGRGLASWHDETPPPLLPLSKTQAIVLDVDKGWLNDRIERRFRWMLGNGALEEAIRNRADWASDRPSAKAIGARELMLHLAGAMTLEQVRDSATIATRQYAKRQRSWLRARMKAWQWVATP